MMRPTGRLLAILLTLALVAPASVLAQSAGDQQYVDPFQGQEGGGGGNGGEQTGGSDDGTTTTTPTAPSDTAGVTAGDTVPETDGATLPRTGLTLLPVILTGLFLLAAGLVLRRRTAPALAAIPQAVPSVGPPGADAATPARFGAPVIGLGLVGLFLLSLLRRRA